MMLHIANKTRRRIPQLPFEQIKNAALGQGYELSLVFVDDKISKFINGKYRHKDHATNILSFPYSQTDGEILLNLDISSRESRETKQKLNNYLVYLFIHGLIHLKGFDHGSRMEEEEQKIRLIFKKYF
ncbi:MAG: rRNA maturation RNase YbeY [Candidatus Vogelbacteria bacterium]|nr:rRNA maturation RNase YbeY [Candidatus Vogelbacteria bacterium]